VLTDLPEAFIEMLPDNKSGAVAFSPRFSKNERSETTEVAKNSRFA
jgi:hypothetical protein